MIAQGCSRTRWACILLVCAVAGWAGTAVARDGGNRESRRAREVFGRLVVLQEDDFERGVTRRIHLLEETATGRTYRLHSSDPRLAEWPSGTRIEVRGTARGDDLVVEAGAQGALRLAADDASPDLAAASTDPLAAVVGARRAIVMLVDFQDHATECSESQVADLMFQGSQSVDGLYREMSFGSVSFPADTDLDGQPDVIRVALPTTAADSCDYGAWASSADSAAEQAGVNLALYQHRVYALPSSADCGWAGLGNLGCFSTCRAWIRTCQLADVYAHELGHNLGMHHASTDEDNDGTTDCEYCDRSDIMGYGGIGLRQVNGPHKEQMGWLGGEHTNTVTAGSAVHVISSIETDPALAPFPQLIRVPREGDFYYVTFREPTGYDASLSSTFRSRLSVHRFTGGGSRTFFIGSLGDSDTLEDHDRGVSVTLLSHDASTATVLIDIDGPPAPVTDLHAGIRRRGQVVLSWSASEEVDVVGYRVYRNGSWLGDASDPRYVDRTTTPGATYDYHVTVVDDQDRESAAGNSIEVDLGDLSQLDRPWAP